MDPERKFLSGKRSETGEITAGHLGGRFLGRFIFNVFRVLGPGRVPRKTLMSPRTNSRWLKTSLKRQKVVGYIVFLLRKPISAFGEPSLLAFLGMFSKLMSWGSRRQFSGSLS